MAAGFRCCYRVVSIRVSIGTLHFDQEDNMKRDNLAMTLGWKFGVTEETDRFFRYNSGKSSRACWVCSHVWHELIDARGKIST